MDNIDRKIIRELQSNARITNNELADKVGLSPSPCLRRIRNLEAEGLVVGYTAIVNQEKYGMPINVFVSVRLERPTEECIKNFERNIIEIEEVMECYLMTGSNDYLLHIVSDSLKSYESLVKGRLSKIPGISTIESSFAFGLIKKTAVFPMN